MTAADLQREIGAAIGRDQLAASVKLIEAQRDAMDAAFDKPIKPLTGRRLDAWIRKARSADILEQLEGQ